MMKKRKAVGSDNWTSCLLECKFFGACLDHRDLRKNEKNMFCIDCRLCLCRHCLVLAASSDLDTCHHRRIIQVCRYVYHDVVRLHSIQKFLDCSNIQAYKINGEKAVHLNPRHHQLKTAKNSSSSSSTKAIICSCGKKLQDLPNIFCSIACKVRTKTNNPIKSQKKIIIIPTTTTKVHNSEEGYVSSSLTDYSSEVIQTMPKKLALHKRKSVIPTRAPMF